MSENARETKIVSSFLAQFLVAEDTFLDTESDNCYVRRNVFCSAECAHCTEGASTLGRHMNLPNEDAIRVAEFAWPEHPDLCFLLFPCRWRQSKAYVACAGESSLGDRCRVYGLDTSDLD